MFHCPYCGTKAKEEESYCIKCGKELPDISSRLAPDKWSKWWLLPISLAVAVILFTSGLYLYLHSKTTNAMELYTEAEEELMAENYSKASELLEDALGHREDFSQGKIALLFTQEALEIEEDLERARELAEDEAYIDSLKLVNQAEERMNRYLGPLPNILVDRIDQTKTHIQLREIEAKVSAGPSIQEVRMLIWDADAINHPEAAEISSQLRSQLVEYIFSRASEALNANQFSDALLITEDGLKYAPKSEKLKSLHANINKEKHAFETAAQKRMEQAMDTAYQEYQQNESDAIELISLDVTNDEDGQVVISGEVKSIATVPINSILIEYTLSENGDEFLSNEIYVFPDELYPDEHGEFEFTHFDVTSNSDDMEARVKRITWYTQ